MTTSAADTRRNVNERKQTGEHAHWLVIAEDNKRARITRHSESSSPRIDDDGGGGGDGDGGGGGGGEVGGLVCSFTSVAELSKSVPNIHDKY